jgi:hypothetical protein
MQAKRGGKAGKYADGGVSERGKAFRAAYDRGEKEFTFNGKRFTTEMAKPSSSKLAAPSISVTRASVTMPAKRQENMSSTELSNLGAQRRAGMAKAVAGKSVSDSPGFDARPMKKADATGQTPTQMYRSMMAESRSMPKAKGNDDLYKLFIDKRGRDFNDKQKQMKMAARASAGRDLVRDANKMGSSDIGDMKRGGKAMKMAVGGAGKTRLGMAPIKRAQGGTATNSTLHPATSNKTGDRRDPEYGDYILADKDAMKKLQGSSSAPVKKAQGGAAKVRRGMMTQSGQITPGVKPHKGIRAC